jgi:hypothetical protein
MIHIHNGDVVAQLAQRSGIPGDHLPFRETLVTGAVPGDGDNWIETRARAIADAHGEDLLRVRTSLVEQEQALAEAPPKGEIVLWFEHDLFCLVHLVYLLHRFRDARLSLVFCPAPLSDNDERSLHLLFESRAAVTPSMIKTAGEVWKAYTADDPTQLNRWLGRDTPDFVFLREGLTLHASRFPSTKNGLGAIEQRALELIASGVSDFGSLFAKIDPGPPRFGFGDSDVLRHLRSMASRAVPLISMSDTIDGLPPRAIFGITPAGENVLRGAVDDVVINDPDRWLGGVHLTKENVWRFDEGERKIIRSPSPAS